jgi:hypothetical protein
MKRGLQLPTLVVSALLLFASSSASVLAQPLAGDHEVEIAGGVFHRQGSDTGNLNLDLHYGYYLTPGWQLGLRQALNYNFIDDARDVWTATTTPFLRYNFNFGRFVPYLGGQMGLVWNDRDTTGTIGPNAGLKIFLTDQTYFTAGYRYDWFFTRLRDVEDNTNRGNHVVNLGLGFVWGGSGTRGGTK